MRAIDGDELLKRVQQEEIQAQIHGREFSTCFMSPGGTPSTEWWYVEDLIENAPTIEPEQKKGKWVEMAGDLQCSECGATYYDLYPDYSDTKFCPNCGSYNGGENDQSK